MTTPKEGPSKQEIDMALNLSDYCLNRGHCNHPPDKLETYEVIKAKALCIFAAAYRAQEQKIAALKAEVEYLHKTNHRDCVTPCDSIRIQQDNHNVYLDEKDRAEKAEKERDEALAKVKALSEALGRCRDGLIGLNQHWEDVESRSAEAHSVYQEEAHRRGDVRHPDAYKDLSEATKEWDRVLVRWIQKKLGEWSDFQYDLSLPKATEPRKEGA